jgi:hypothetical protein
MGLDISICINVDTRPENDTNKEMFNGVVSRDFLIEGVKNKINLFNGFEKEVIVFCDMHEPIDEKTLAEMSLLCDTLIIRKHDKRFEDVDNFNGFNDMNYINALSQCRGAFVFHFDGDVAAFAPNQDAIKGWIELLKEYDYISYPSLFSPNPDRNDNYNYWWISTRFFCCKRSTLDFTEIIKCQLNYDYMFSEYPASVRNHWLEHILGVMAKFKGKGVLYPEIDLDKIILFTWENYHKYTLQRLNNQTYDEVKKWVQSKNYHYPCNLTI